MPEGGRGSAVVSADGRYRYELWRHDLLFGRSYAQQRRVVAFVMLDPSTADATADDPTIRRCCGFARLWGYDTLAVVNLYGFRATGPASLRALAAAGGDPVGPDNPHHVQRVLWAAEMTVAAWGAHGHGTSEEAQVLRLYHPPGGWRCLGTTKAGAPRHPLYVAAATPLVPLVLP